jgi:trimeric autotransporter adhesin
MTNDRESAYSAGVVRGEAGAPANPTGTSVRFPGTPLQALVSKRPVVNPSVFTLETWFRTTTATGGRLIGFGSSNSPTALSTSYDRFVSMLNNGTLRYSVFNGTQNVITSTRSYNDGQWHLATATQGGDGTRKLYVDGALVATGAPVVPQAYTGYWRLGSDNTWSESTSPNFAGSLDEAAVYETTLPADVVNQHYLLGRPAGANQPPVARLTVGCDQLACTADGSGSTDADGTVAGYAWSFGDGSTGTGATASHSYAAPGTYTVTLTVTDDLGATDLASRPVTVSANQAPAAAFSATATGASVAVDGSGSTDADGTVAGYAWDFGDGGTGTGATASHSYTVSGTYTVTLTVTDDRGATGSVTHPVTVTVPVPPLASDTFERTVASGFGTADSGGGWTFAGTGSTASVGGGSGLVTVGIGRNPSVLLPGVSSQDTRVSHTVWTEAMPTGGGTYLATVVRSNASGSYRARVKVLATGVTSLQLTRVVAAVETTLGTAVTVPGLTYTAGTRLRVVAEAVGSGTTTLRAKVWVDGATEPAGWTNTQTDTTAGLQGTGSVGFAPYLSASATATLGLHYDDLVVSTATP